MLKRITGCVMVVGSIILLHNLLFPITKGTTRELNLEIRRQHLSEFEEVTKEYIEAQRQEQERLEQIRIQEEQARLIAEEEMKQPKYNPYNLREPSNLTEEQIHQMLEGKALQTLSRAYYYAEQEYGVNALFLIALNAEESGWGRSSLAISNNNLGGIKRKDGSYAYFDDWGSSLNYIANLINENYLNENGLFYNGTSIWDVNIKYCTQNTWADKINTIAYELLNKIY